MKNTYSFSIRSCSALIMNIPHIAGISPQSGGATTAESTPSLENTERAFVSQAFSASANHLESHSPGSATTPDQAVEFLKRISSLPASSGQLTPEIRGDVAACADLVKTHLGNLSVTQINEALLALHRIDRTLVPPLLEAINHSAANIEPALLQAPTELLRLVGHFSNYNVSGQSLFRTIHRCLDKGADEMPAKSLVTLGYLIHQLGYRSPSFYEVIATTLAPRMDELNPTLQARCRRLFNKVPLNLPISVDPDIPTPPAEIISSVNRLACVGAARSAHFAQTREQLARYFDEHPNSTLSGSQSVQLATALARTQNAAKHADLWEMAHKGVQANLARLSIKDLFQLLSAHTNVGHRDIALLEHSAKKFLERPDLVKSHYDEVVRSAARQNWCNRELFGQIKTALINEPNLYSIESQANIIWSFARLNELDNDLVAHTISFCRTACQSMSGEFASKMSFVAAIIGGEIGQEIFSMMDRRMPHVRADSDDHIRHTQAKVALHLVNKRDLEPTVLQLNQWRSQEVQKRQNDFEYSVGQALSQLNISSHAQAVVAGFEVDFVLGKKLLLECNGDQYHKVTGTDRQTGHDIFKIRTLENCGFTVIKIESGVWAKLGSDQVKYLSEMLSSHKTLLGLASD